MNALTLPGAPAWFDALLILSIQATLLAGIVWAIVKLLGRWISPQWRALLWFVVVARVLIPFAPPSPLSLQNLFVKPSAARSIAAVPPRLGFQDDSREVNLQTTRGVVNSTVFPAPAAAAPRTPSDSQVNPAKALAIVWATGAMLLFALLIARSLIIRHRLVRHGRAPDSKTLEAIAECSARLRLRFPIRATISDRIAAPALTGLIPARLIVPTGFARGQFTREQMRQILLHELAHIKQGHLVLHWLTLLARTLQWCNPVIHFAAARLRHECELAADAVALKDSAPDERAAYGETILQVLARSSAPSTLLAMGMADRTRHLEQRLRALGEARRKSFRTMGILVFATIAVAGLSGATARGPSDASKKSAQRIRYTLRVVDCPVDSISRVVEVLALEERSTPPLGGPSFTNFMINPAQTRLLEKVKDLSGTDFLTSPGKDFEVGAAGRFVAYEDPPPEVWTNLPPNTWFSPDIEIVSSSLKAGVLAVDSKLAVPTFLGYSTNIDVPSGAPLPQFRVRSTAAKQSVPLGGSIVFYVPPSRRANPTARDKVPVFGGDVPTLGHLFRTESTNIARLVFLTPSLADGSGESQPGGASASNQSNAKLFVPNSPTPIRTVPAIIVNPPFAPPTTTDGVAISYRQALSLFPDKTGAPHTNLPAPSGRLDTLRDERTRSLPAIEDARPLIDIGRFHEVEANNRLAPDSLYLSRLLDGESVSEAFSGSGAVGRVTLSRIVTNAVPSQQEQQIPEAKKDVAAVRPGYDQGEGRDVLITRSFRVDPNIFLEALADGTGSNKPFEEKAREGQISYAKTVRNIDALQRSVREFFVAAGVGFPTNSVRVGGAVPSGFGFARAGEAQPAMFFNDHTGVLFVRAREADLNIIENALHALNARANPPQVRLDVRIFDSGPKALSQALRPLFPIPPIPSDVLTNMTNFFLSPTIAAKFIENAEQSGLLSVKDMSSVTVAGRQVRIGDESVRALEPGDTEVILDVLPALGPGLSGLELSSVVTTTSRLPTATNEPPRFRVNNRIIPNSGIPPGASELICVPVRRSKRISVVTDAATAASVQELAHDSRTWLILITPTMLEPAKPK